MSKSLDNIIDPLDMIKKYGADATRLSLIIGTGPGNDMKLSEDKVKGYKNFSNKIWNIARFILAAAEGERVKMVAGGKPEIVKVEAVSYDPDFKSWTSADLAHLKRLGELTTEVTREMEEYKFYLVGEKLYHYIWHELADKILEESKPIIAGDDVVAMTSRIQFLLHVLKTSLKLLHPFMPYVTEEIWADAGFVDSKNSNKDGKGLLMVEEWPSNN